METTIRTATPADASRIADIHVRAWQSAYRGLLPDDALDGMRPDQRLPMWSRILSHSNSRTRVLVAVRDQSLLGFASIGPSRDSAKRGDTSELFAIYVDPDHQRRGAGARLLHAAETAMRGSGATLAMLWVLDGNLPAQRFYRNHGWSCTGEMQTDTLFGIDLREMKYTKPLDRTSTVRKE